MFSRVETIDKYNINVRPETRLLLVCGLLYLLFLAYLEIGFGFELVQSDVLGYWNWSSHWRTPFDEWWVPGYPLTIALVRALTFYQVPPVAVVVSISFLFYLISVRTVYSLARELNVEYEFEVALLFAVYPFVGLTYCVYPIADSMATALLLLSCLSFQRQRWTSFAIFVGLALLAHKATWFFMPPVMLVAFISHKKSRLPLLLAVVPLLTWIIGGAFYRGDPLWFARWSVGNLVVSQSKLAVFDGLVGSLLSGGATKILKGLVVLGTFISAVFVFIHSIRSRFWLGMCISLPIISMTALLNQYEIWASIRWSKVLLIPLAFVLLCHVRVFKSPRISPHLFRLLFLFGILSNLVFGYYLTRYLTP